MIIDSYGNVQELLDAYAIWSKKSNLLRDIGCRGELHSVWLCCDEHKLLNAENHILTDWACYFHHQASLPPFENAPFLTYEGGTQIFSKNWIMDIARATGAHIPAALIGED
jgi:hypothetical protein